MSLGVFLALSSATVIRKRHAHVVHIDVVEKSVPAAPDRLNPEWYLTDRPTWTVLFLWIVRLSLTATDWLCWISSSCSRVWLKTVSWRVVVLFLFHSGCYGPLFSKCFLASQRLLFLFFVQADEWWCQGAKMAQFRPENNGACREDWCTISYLNQVQFIQSVYATRIHNM